LKELTSQYQEGYAVFDKGAGFFRSDSIITRDFSVLCASLQFQEKKDGKTIRWLDLMTGCGVRALRWGIESVPLQAGHCSQKDLEIWANDADPNLFNLINSNLQPLLKRGITFRVDNDLAQRILSKAYLEKRFFDLIDLDCFGCPNSLLEPLIRVLSFDGIVMLSSTDGRSITGHDRKSAIRSLSASARVHPASWEIAIRLQLGAIASKAWLFGRGIEPILSFSDGRTFRIFVRLKKGMSNEEESQLGFIARCNICGAQTSQQLIKLGEWKDCLCDKSSRHLIVNGPLWLGPLQSSLDLIKIKELSKELSIPINKKTEKIINRLLSDIGAPCFSWSTHELASRLPLNSPPPLDFMTRNLKLEGYQAFRSSIDPGYLRTNAPIGELLRICEEKFSKGFK